MAEKSRKRSDILEAAWVLFRDNGFHATKMSDIAEKAGVGKGTVYEYFSSKQEVFEAACLDILLQANEFIEHISKKNITFREKITEIIDYELNIMKDGNFKIEVVIRNKNVISEKMLKLIHEGFRDIYMIFNDIVDQGKAEGEIRKDISSDIIAHMIMGASDEYLKIKVFSNDMDSHVNYDEIFDLFFNGIGVK